MKLKGLSQRRQQDGANGRKEPVMKENGEKKKSMVDPKQDMPLIFFWHSLFIFQVSSPSALKLSSINLCI